MCGCKAGSACTDDKVCSHGTKDIDCPVAGCYGFEITLPSRFVAQPQALLPPTPTTFQATGSYFNDGTVTSRDGEVKRSLASRRVPHDYFDGCAVVFGACAVISPPGKGLDVAYVGGASCTSNGAGSCSHT
jgi:hypothetical protein